MKVYLFDCSQAWDSRIKQFAHEYNKLDHPLTLWVYQFCGTQGHIYTHLQLGVNFVAK